MKNFILPAGSSIWPVIGYGKVNFNTGLFERVWCEKRKKLTHDVIVTNTVEIPNNKKFSKFLPFPDERYRIGYLPKFVVRPNATVMGFVFCVNQIATELSVPTSEHSLLTVSRL